MVIHACSSSILGLRQVGSWPAWVALHFLSEKKIQVWGTWQGSTVEVQFTKVLVPVILINFKL